MRIISLRAYALVAPSGVYSARRRSASTRTDQTLAGAAVAVDPQRSVEAVAGLAIHRAPVGELERGRIRRSTDDWSLGELLVQIGLMPPPGSPPAG